ncbi:MAG: DUF2283 domain-containing protein [Verrucomicrobiota bacterium]|jgi:uncharacterized protein YuzE
MKIQCDKETDSLTIMFRDARVKESDEIRPGVIADFGYDGGVAGFEILDAQKCFGGNETIRRVELEWIESDTDALVLHDKPAKKYGPQSCGAS